MNALMQKIRAQPPILWLVEAGAVIVAAAAAWNFVEQWWPSALAGAAALAVARRKWPRVRLRHYFRTRKAVLPVVATAGGFGLMHVLLSLVPGITASASLLLVMGLVAAGALMVTMMIFEGKLMKDVFELVPAEQRDALREFLSGVNPGAGQQADFSKLDPAAVIAALEGRVIGQDRVVEDVVRTAFRRAQLVRPAKPLAVFFFVGPTGVGKSELAKALAAELFGGRIINLPLNQMTTKESLWTLLGSPRGYMGSEAGGTLTRDLGRLGTGVLVLDEVEKAAPEIIKALMRLLDEGQVTEQSTGTVYSARGFIIVATSNAAAEEIGKIAAVEADADQRGAKVRAALREAKFPPEILSRFDEIFAFRPLDRRDVARVVVVMVQRHAAAAGVQVDQVDAELLIDLIQAQETGSDLGMRGLDRQVERRVLDGFLALKNRGVTHAAVRVRDGRVVVEPMAVQTSAPATGGAP